MVTGPDHPQGCEKPARPSAGYCGNRGSPPTTPVTLVTRPTNVGNGFRIFSQDGVCKGKRLSWQQLVTFSPTFLDTFIREGWL